MLDVARKDQRSNQVVMRSLTDDPEHRPLALGCVDCALKETCGGLSVEAPILDCMDLCCGSPETCTRVCRMKPETFVDQVREIGGFLLRDTPSAPLIEHPSLPQVIPLIFHGSSRQQPLDRPVVALPLPTIVDYQAGKLRFKTREDLCKAFRVSLNVRLILTGVNQDHRIEPWWTLGVKRKAIILQMKELGIELVTAPNFSVILDNPRHDDLHAIKRIGIIFSEFLECGLPCALHPNGRTEMDFVRWARFINAREEVKTISYEFITGPGRKARRDFHLRQLKTLASTAGRDLDIVVRGDPSVVPFLQKFYRRVTFIDSTAFMKSLKRFRAVRASNSHLEWQDSPTAPNETVDSLLLWNVAERDALLSALYFDNTYQALAEAA